MRPTILLILVTLVTEGNSGPIINSSEKDQTSCARRCEGTSKFNYAPGTTYEFEYNVHTSTTMEGASSEREAVVIQATANIEVLSKCDLALQLQDVSIHQFKPVMFSSLIYPDVTGEFKQKLERYPLRFSFQDGVVEELCPFEGESVWALNIKRGFLTAFQNSMTSLDRDETVKEKDITGECSTNYMVAYRGWFSKTIKKTKDLSGCTDRNGYRSFVNAMPYRVPSDIQSLPLMKSTHECEQEVDKNGWLKSALIRETHTFRPFSQATSGATTKIEQRLNYKTQRSGVTTRQEIIQRRARLMFEHMNSHESRKMITKDVENKLNEICVDTLEDTRPDTPKLFADLVYCVKHLDVEDLRSVYRNVKKGTICTKNNARIKKFFFDSLPMTSTSASVHLMKEILLEGEVTGAQATMWMTSFSFIHNPTPEMLQEVKGLLDTPQYSKASMLPISTMINNYCSHHDSCSEEYAVINIVNAIENVIGSRCFIRDSNLESVLLALRALGNAGHLDRLTTALSRCYSRQSNSAEIRITAIQAFRRVPCTTDRNDILHIYQDENEDSEVRIAAYLAVMECPDDNLLKIIQETLECEKSSQVGSFVWTHLLNLVESSSPHKQSIKLIVKDKRLYRPFDMERLKYSRNYEGSVFWDNINLGSAIESNLIFSEMSPIARSLSLNLTVDLFGSSLNLLELGGRIEGLEYMMQTYLDETGYFRAWTKDKIKPNANLKSLKGDVYMRMFGNELYYNHFKGTDPLASAKKLNFLEMLINIASNKDFSFTQSVMILDTSMVIPTSCGIPLNLTVNGTATIDLQASGQVDLRKLTTSPSSMLIDGMIKPSGAIQIAGSMTMDAVVTKIGLKVVNTWHSSTSLKGRVEVNRGKILRVELDVPQKEITILNVSTEFFRIHGDREIKDDLLTDNRKTLELCTGSRLAILTGLELCNGFQWTNASRKADAPYFPFTGPFSQSLILHKRDTHTGYKLMAKRSVKKGTSTAQIVLDTPGSRIDRSIDLSIVLNEKLDDTDLKIRLASPWKKAKLEGSLFYNKKKIGIRGKIALDKTEEYSISTEVGIQRTKNRITFTPRLEVRRPGVKDILFSGKVTTADLRNANVYLVLTGVKSNDITLKADMADINNKNMYKGSLKGTFNLSPGEDYSAEASVLYREMERRGSIITVIPTLTIKGPKQNLVSVLGSGVYKKGKSLKSKMSFDVPKLTDKPLSLECDLLQMSGRRTKYSGHFKISSEVLKTKLSGNVHMKRGTTGSTFSLDYNLPRMRNIKADKVVVKSKIIDRSSRARLHYKINLHFSDKRRPHLNLVSETTFSHQAKQSEVDVSLKYGHKSRDPSHHVTAYSLVRHVVTKTSADVTYNVRLGLGPMDHVSHLEGKYKYDPSSIISTTAFKYGKSVNQDGNQKEMSNDDVNAKFTLKPSVEAEMEMNFTQTAPGHSILDVQTGLKTHLLELRRSTSKYHQVLSQSQVRSQAQLHYGNGKIISSDVTFMTSPSVQINIVVETPFKAFRTSKILVTHHGPLKNCRSYLHIDVMGYTTTCDTNLKYGSSVTAGLSATSNVKDVERVSALLNYERTSSHLTLIASASLQNTTLGGSILGRRAGRVTNASLIVWTPFKNFRETGFEVQCHDYWYKNNSATVKFMDGKTIEWRMGYSRYEPRGWRDIIELKTPFKGFEIYSLKVEGSFGKKAFLNFTFIYGNGKTITFDTVFEEKKEMDIKICQISFVATTPFLNYEFNKAVFGGRGREGGKNFTGFIEILFSDTKIAVQTSLLNHKIKTGKLFITTNIKNYENIRGTFNISSRYRYLNATSSLAVNGDTVETELTSDDRSGHILGFKVRTPFINYKNVGFSFNRTDVNGSRDILWEYSVMYMDGKEITVNITEILEGVQMIKIEMETPFKGYENQSMQIIFPRRRKCCKGHIGLKVTKSDGKEMEISSVYNLSRARHLDINFTALAEDTGGKIRIKCVMNNDIPVHTEFQTELRLPYEGYEEQKIHYKHAIGNGSLEGKLELVQIREADVLITMKGMKELNDIDGEISVTWHKDDPNSSIRILTSLKDRSSHPRTDKKLNIKLVHPSQSLALVGEILCTHEETQGHGEFIWNEDDGQKIFFDVDVKDNSRHHSKMYDGTMKVGSSIRSLQMDGSYSDTGVMRTIDGTFYWDADRDNMKQVGMKAVVTPGTRNKKTDLSFKIPSIGKDIIVANEITMGDGRTVFSGKTKLSYSSDHQKTLILTTRLEDISGGYSNTNYSLEFGIKHPYTDVDIKMTSYLGSSSEKFTGGIDVFYLTDWRERKNFVLRGDIFKTMNRVELQMTSPLKTMVVSGEIKKSPYKLLIKNRLGSQMMKADVTVDTRKRRIDLQTSYDIDDPWKNLHVTARYLNSSDVQASVHRDIYSAVVLDSLINFKLNASRLLHTRLAWRPQIIAELQAFLRKKVDQHGKETKRVFHTVYESVGQELSGKYYRITQAVSEEMTPFMRLLETEMATIERQLNSVRRDIRRMYSQNEMVMRQAGEYLDKANILYKVTLRSFMTTFTSTMRKVRKQMEKIKEFPIRERYDNVLSDLLDFMKRTADKAVTEVKGAISRLDDELLTVWQVTRQHYVTVQNAAIDSIEKVVDLPGIIDNNLQISNSVSPYVNSLYTNTIHSYENVKDMVQNSGKRVTSYMVDAEQREDLNQLYTLTKEIYQEGVSAYNQWKDNGGLDNNLTQFPVDLGKNVVDYLNDEVFYYRPNVTVWNPDHGEVQVELYLPISLKCINTLAYVEKAKKVVSKYLPDNRTVKKYLPTSLWQSNDTT